MRRSIALSVLLVFAAAFGFATCLLAGQERLVRVELSYAAPGQGPAPNFSPKGTQVALSDAPTDLVLPAAAVRPAKIGTIAVGPGAPSAVPVLVTSQAEHPKDLCRLYLDRNRNRDFEDDGAPVAAVPTLREKTGDTWSSFSDFELSIPYGKPGEPAITEPYRMTAWIVRRGDVMPDVLRVSVRSWRSGATTVNGVPALVAAMDADNDGLFRAGDTWSVLEASAPDAAKRVLTMDEARDTSRLMFLRGPAGEQVLEFREFGPDGRTITFAVVDRKVTKSQDRAGDDALSAERGRPRATTPFPWSKDKRGFDAALASARTAGKRVVLDFWTTWCGPCAMMDQWIWTDAEVTSVLRAGYIGVKLDGDVEEALVKRFNVTGYPTIIVLDATGREVTRASGYLSSKDLLALLSAGGK